MCFSAKSIRGSRATVRPGRAFRLLRACAIVFLIILIACQPAVAASTTDSQIMMMSDDDDPDAGIMPLTIITGTNIVFSSSTYDSNLLHSLYDFSFSRTVTLDSSMVGQYFTSDATFRGSNISSSPVAHGDSVMYTIDLYDLDRSIVMATDCKVKLGNLIFYTYKGYPALNNGYAFVPSDLVSISYQLLRGPSFDEAVWSSSQPLSKSCLSGTLGSLSTTNIVFDSGRLPTSMTVIGSSIYSTYGIRFTFTFTSDFYNSSDIYGTIVGFGNSDSSFFSFSTVGSTSSTTQNQEMQDAIKETTSAVNQVNQSIQQTISAVQQVSADLAALSNAVQQMTQQFLSGLEQQTNAISSLVTAQIQQIRQDLGLVNHNLSSGFSSVTNSITNQTQQVTQKIDTLQQTVVNKLDTVNQSITDLTDETKKGFDDVKKGITDLPGKIGEMLKSLIVPDSEQLADKYSDFTDLAEEKLGVIYQVPEMVFEMAQTVVNGVTNQETQMQLPAFKLVMPDAEYTLWEEQKFDIWPAGTEAIQNAVQLATSMLCVILTFNSLKRKYEEWLDGR